MPNPVDLEPQAKAVVDANANPPYLFELGPDPGRRTIDAVQSGPVKKPTVDVEDTTVPGGPSGQVSVRILRPQGARRPLAVIVYLHGPGWVFGNHHTHDRRIRELAVGAQAAVVFPNYSRSPEAKYPRPSRSAMPWPAGSPSTDWSLAWTPAVSRSPGTASVGT
jgi:acetyl esterase